MLRIVGIAVCGRDLAFGAAVLVKREPTAIGALQSTSGARSGERFDVVKTATSLGAGVPRNSRQRDGKKREKADNSGHTNGVRAVSGTLIHFLRPTGSSVGER